MERCRWRGYRRSSLADGELMVDDPITGKRGGSYRSCGDHASLRFTTQED
ncbi:MAG: hypothetical protein U0903_19780 [Planctomycetales bacterium]